MNKKKHVSFATQFGTLQHGVYSNESEIMFYFSLFCNIQTAGQNGQKISNNRVSLCKHNSEPDKELRLQAALKAQFLTCFLHF